MVLIKNQANQYVYTKIYNYASGAAQTNVVPADVTAYIFVDGENTTLTTTVNTNTFQNLGNGYYRFKITNNLDCDAGIAYFVIVTSGVVAEPVRFTTTTTSYDGVSQEKLFEMLLAFMANKVTIAVTANDTKVISYKNRLGDTEIFNITVKTTDGSRQQSGSIT